MEQLWGSIFALMTSWKQGKLFLERAFAVSNDGLHVIIGVLAWVVLALLVRRPLGSWRPWFALVLVLLWNELVDLTTEQWPNPGEQYGEAAKDLLLTLFVPTVLLFAVRYRPDLFRSRRR